MLQRDAPFKAWPILENRELRLPVCSKGCGYAGVCLSCGILASLLADGLSQVFPYLEDLPEEAVALLEPLWSAWNCRIDLRLSPMMPESTFVQAVRANRTMGSDGVTVSGFGAGLARIGKH